MLKFLEAIEKIDKSKKLKFEANIINTFSIDQYEYFLEDLKDNILNNFIIKNKKIDLYLDKKFIKTATIAELFIQLIFWKANVVYRVKLLEKHFQITSNMTSGEIHDAIEILLQRFRDHFQKKDIDREELAIIATDIIEKIMNFTIIFSWISPDSINLYDLIQFSKRDPRFNKLIHSQLDENMNTKEIEQRLAQLEKELIQCILQDKRNCLYQYVATGTVNKSQLRQMFTVVGTRAGIDKTVLTSYIKGNFLNGLQSPSEFFAEAMTARTALIDKNTYVADSGYEARKIDLNNLDTTIDYSVEDCKTKHFLTINVRSEFLLNALNNKYQILDDGSLHAIDSEKDKHLIGQKIRIRSHAMCALPKNVCKTCYGANADLMKNTRIGCFPSIEVESHVTNMTISSKHFSETNSSDISESNLVKFFNVEKNSAYLKTELDYTNIKLVIDKLYLENLIDNNNSAESEEDYDMVHLENALLIETVFDKKLGRTVQNEYLLTDTQGLYLFITSELLEEKKAFKISHDSDIVEIYLDKINLETPIFSVILMSEGTTYYLDRFVKLIDSNLNKSIEDPNIVLNDILEIIETLKIKCKIQHIETMLKNLIKDKNDLSRHPDFRKNNVEIQMLSMRSSIMNKDIYTSMLFENHIDQLRNVLFFRKTGDGVFDCFFRTTHKYVDFDNKNKKQLRS